MRPSAGALESVVQSLSFGCSQCYKITVSRAVHLEEKVFPSSAEAVCAELCLPLCFCGAGCSWWPQDAPAPAQTGRRSATDLALEGASLGRGLRSLRVGFIKAFYELWNI